jgi:hypothetical protein
VRRVQHGEQQVLYEQQMQDQQAKAHFTHAATFDERS